MIQDLAATEVWRPQRFGRRNVKQVDDPVIEPLWSGLRVLALVAGEDVELRGDDGAVQRRPAIVAELRSALQADHAVLDGYVTIDAARSGVGVYSGAATAAPTAAEMTRQMVLGGGGRNRRSELVDALEAQAPTEAVPDEGVVFVAVDLLLLDGESLLDVPLLERKRLLDGVVVPSNLVRVGIHVRPPIGPWLGTWRSTGFRQLAYKHANGRYRPGEVNDGWATANIPTR